MSSCNTHNSEKHLVTESEEKNEEKTQMFC